MIRKLNDYTKVAHVLKRLAFLCLLAICCSETDLYSQNTSLVDSLESVYLEDDFEEEKRLQLLKELSKSHYVSDKKLFYSDELIRISSELDSTVYLTDGYLERGNAQKRKGDLTHGLESYFEALEVATNLNDERGTSLSYGSIASIYTMMGDHDNSVLYHLKSVKSFTNAEDKNDSISLASLLLNLGFEYIQLKKPDSAIIYFEQSGAIFEKTNFDLGLAYYYGNMGLAYAEKDLHEEAEINLNKGISMLEGRNDYYGISDMLEDMARLYISQGEYNNAAIYANRSLKIARQHGLKEQISQANLELSKIYESLGDSIKSYKYFKNHITYRDSIFNLSAVQEVANLRTNFEVSQKQLEVDLLNQQKRTQRIALYSLGLGLVLIVIFYRRISREKNRSDMLLLNILPSKTAQELKENGKVKAKKFEAVTVMFTDFEAFTSHSHDLSPEKLVKTVDFFFSAFDRIMEKYGLEKIKTIGDAYMCTGGLAKKEDDQPIKVILAAFEILDFVGAKEQSENTEIAHFRIRIGINTGPVVGGVVGTKKFAYDIWGDTVNVAARMESNSEPCKVNISENTYQLVKDRFNCEYRGEIQVKNKGMMKMYFVNPDKSTKPSLTKSTKKLNSKSTATNKLFKKVDKLT